MTTETRKDYWLISVPGEPSLPDALERVNKVTSALSKNSEFHLPHLKVGTLDQLFENSDEFVKEDSYIEGVLKTIVSNLSSLLKEEKKKPQEDNFRIDIKFIDMYLRNFRWNEAKYNSTQPVRSIFQKIHEQTLHVETDQRRKWEDYTKICNDMSQYEKKNLQNLLRRDLSIHIKKEHVIQNSKYLTTVFSVVPSGKIREWKTTYETLTENVVPRTSQLLVEEKDFSLFSVVILHGYREKPTGSDVPKEIRSFMNKALENKFTIRLHHYDEVKLTEEKEKLKMLEVNFKRQRILLMRWLRINFSEVFTAWIHLKGLRLFVDSVLRYGLPINFQGILMKPLSNKSDRKLRQVLSNIFSHLDSSGSKIQGSSDDKREVKVPGLESFSEYHPYVGFKFIANFDTS